MDPSQGQQATGDDDNERPPRPFLTDWYCVNCQSHNFKRRDFCYRCRANRPNLEGLDGENDASSSEAETPGSKSRSFVYEYFQLSTMKDKYTCAVKGCRSSISNSKKGGITSNLLRHLKQKHKSLIQRQLEDSNRQTQPSINDFLQATGSQTMTQFKFEDQLVEFVITTDQPFTIVEEPSFRLLCATIKFKIPGADALKNKAMRMYDDKIVRIKETLKEVKGKFSVILDVWSSINQFAFHGIIVQWVNDDWELQELILTLDVLEGSHTGERLAQSIVKVLEEFEILDRIAALTTDNASNYETCFQHLSLLLPQKGVPFSASDQHIRCLAHIVNLACQDALKILKKEKSLHQYECDQDQDEDSVEDDLEDIAEFKDSIYHKLRTGIKKIRTSVLLKEALRRQCEAFGLKCKELVKDNSTRWNSTYKMLTRALELRQAFETTLRNNKKLQNLVLTDLEWEKVNDIAEFLKPFNKMTLYLEQKGIPTMSLSAMIYIELYNHVEGYTEDHGHSWFLIEAAKRACEKLNKYYPTSDGLAFVAGTVLDPRCKMAWYASVKFEPTVVKGYKRALQQCWLEYKPAADQNPKNLPEAGQKENSDDLFAIQMKRARIEKRDELQLYLDEMVVSPTSEHVKLGSLHWWKIHEAIYPNLSKMARDFLCVSGTGVPIERFFSFGPHLLAPNRRKLLPETIKKCLCLKGWLKSENQLALKTFVHNSLVEKMYGA